MDANEFLKFLEQCIEVGGKEGAAAILFELSREEMETNSKYSAAYAAVKKCLGDSAPAAIDEGFKEIRKDENDHCVKFQLMASNEIGVKLGSPNS